MNAYSEQPEDRLHRYIAEYLSVAAPQGFFWTSLENRQVGPKEGARRKRRGCKAGVPDIVTSYAGRTVWLEIKTKTGRLNEAQKKLHPEIIASGCAVHVVRSVEDVYRSLKEAGVPLKATPA